MAAAGNVAPVRFHAPLRASSLLFFTSRTTDAVSITPVIKEVPEDDVSSRRIGLSHYSPSVAPCHRDPRGKAVGFPATAPAQAGDEGVGPGGSAGARGSRIEATAR